MVQQLCCCDNYTQHDRILHLKSLVCGMKMWRLGQPMLLWAKGRQYWFECSSGFVDKGWRKKTPEVPVAISPRKYFWTQCWQEVVCGQHHFLLQFSIQVFVHYLLKTTNQTNKQDCLKVFFISLLLKIHGKVDFLYIRKRGNNTVFYHKVQYINTFLKIIYLHL